MSQPPPPPNQPPGPPPNQPPSEPPNEPPNQPPPSGGFGAPQDPPPSGGFGAPQSPPPGPPSGGFGAPQSGSGYGYPQTPPPGQPGTPPPGAAPGQPHTQPMGQSGYGYPGQQQPQYGAYQQPPTMPMQGGAGPGMPGAPGAPGGKKPNTTMMIVIAAAVAVALIIGGGVWYASSTGDDDKKDESKSSAGASGGGEGEGGEGKGGEGTDVDKPAVGDEKVPSNTNAKVQFQLPLPKVDEETSPLDVHGSWITDKVYAKSDDSKIVGYDPDKGSEKWTIDLDGPVCAASRVLTKDNKTAIIHQPDKPTEDKKHHGCTEVVTIDLDTGKKVWTETAKASDRPLRFDEVTIAGDTVAAGGTGGGAAWGIADGKLRWKPKVTDTCYDGGYGGGEALVVVRKCGSYDDRKVEIQYLNPTTGAVKSTYKMADGIEYAHVVSTEPVVVAAKLDTEARGYDYFALDVSGKEAKVRSKITAPGDQYGARCAATDVADCRGQVVSDDKLYLPTAGEFGKSNAIVSFDLATGKSTGDKVDAGEKWEFQPLRMDGDNILAYKFPPYDQGGQVVTIDPNTMKETLLLQMPADRSIRSVETGFLFDHSEFLYQDGRLYLSKQLASDRNYGKEYLAISFGPS
ncbi:outer membrane protein assembly factor BamB family protein [Streptomyces apocyni]|uniref:outer membrane protein assembly factor BamB family protein n=1 Tax=Streptomyces apocyni TaxID=2654677 RepID=UPI0012E9E1B1|nr:PQQ-binding-like beta-propeller repeat protein [Streptomyces apocyni]